MTLRKIAKILLGCVLGFVLCALSGVPVLAYTNPRIQTNSATNIQNTSVILNGNLTDLGGYGTVNVWFQWGTNTSYGNSTNYITKNYTGNFSQQIFNLSPNQTFHYRAVVQSSYGITFGQDMSFTTGQSYNQTIIVNAGPNLYLSSGQSQTLQGYAYASSGGYINYSWACTGGSLSNPNIAQPVYTAPYVNPYNNQVTYTCTFTASNSFGQSNSSPIIIYVNYGSNAYASLTVQTNSATNIYANQATLNGHVSGASSNNTYVWFQWGTNTSYGNESNHQTINYSGSFSQNIANLASNQIYHFRSVAQNRGGNIVYGQDMSFVAGTNTYNPVYGAKLLSASKTVRNLSSGNLIWSSSINAEPSDILQFSVVVQATGNQPVHNIYIQNEFPQNLFYHNNLVVQGAPLSGDITQGINIGDLFVGQKKTITYQVQVAPAVNFPYGQTALTSLASISSAETTDATATVTINITKSGLLGATNIPTGLTNNIFADSFFFPLILIVLASWFWKSGIIDNFVSWLKSKHKIN